MQNFTAKSICRGRALLLLTALALGACSQPGTESPVTPETPAAKTVTLSLRTSATRTSLENDSRVVWKQGDPIMINGSFYTVTPDTSDPTTALVADVPASDSYTAAYSRGSEIRDTELMVVLPSWQFFEEGSFGQFVNPMVAYSTSTDLFFKNVCGIVRLGVTGSAKLSTAVFTDNNGQPLAGELLLSRSKLANGDYSFQFGDDCKPYIAFDCAQAPALGTEPQYLYLVVPPRTYENGFSVTLIDSEGNVCIRPTEKSLTVGRSQITDMEAFAFAPDQTPVAVTVDETGPTSITARITAAPYAALGVHVIAKSLWESLLAGSSLTESELIKQILIDEGATFTQAGADGTVTETITAAYTRTGNTVLSADTEYYIVAGYSTLEDIAGAVKTAARTAAAQGEAPTLVFTQKTPAERPFAQSILNIVSNGTAVRIFHTSGAEYDAMKTASTDAEIVSERGFDLTKDDISSANSVNGYDRLFENLTSNTRYVLLATATSVGGTTVTSKKEYTTPHYIDPSAVWTTVSTTSSIVAGGLFEYWGRNDLVLDEITVQKMENADIYRVVNLFRSPRVAEEGFIPTSDEDSYLIVDATNPENIVIEPYENNQNTAYTGNYAPERRVMSILIGSASLHHGGEPGRIGFEENGNLNIMLGTLFCHGMDMFGNPYITPDFHGGYLDIRINTFNGAGTENFIKEGAQTPW